MVNIHTQFSTQYIPFFTVLPPHFGHGIAFSASDASVADSAALHHGFGPGVRLSRISGNAASTFFRS